MLPHLPSISIIDGVIAAVFILQILWGAKLGFAPATFSLAGEILGLVVGILYSSAVAQFLDKQFNLVTQLGAFLSTRTHIPPQYLDTFSNTIYEVIVFFIIFTGIQTGFFYMGKFIHHQVGVRRVTYLSNSFFGMFVGAIKATLEVIFFLIAWNAITANPNIQAGLKLLDVSSHLTQNSILLPFFLHIVPNSSPLTKFFQ